MPEADSDPGVYRSTEANGSAPPEDTDTEASTVHKHGEETKADEKLNNVKEKNSAEEMKAGEEKSGAEGVKEEEANGGDEVKEEKIDAEGVKEQEMNGGDEVSDAKRKNAVEGMKEEKEKYDLKELNGVEESMEIEGTRTVNKVNAVEETKEGEAKSGVKDITDEKVLNKLEETMQKEENKGAAKTKAEKEQVNAEDRMQGIGKEDLEEKKGADEKMDIEKAFEDKVGWKGEKETEDVKMEKVEDAKEEERVRADAKEATFGEKVEEKDDAKGKVDVWNTEEIDDNKEAKWSTKKRSRSGRKIGMKGEGKEKKEEIKKAGETKEKKEGANKAVEAKEKNETGKKSGEANEKDESVNKDREPLSSPTPSSVDRPVRERKTVERLVEVIDKEANKPFVVEKGRGTPLKDIPNVARKLARKKPEDLKLLHHILFGRKGKTIDFKNHILQFSGFAWHGSDEKQSARIKERLDKYVKDNLLEFCDLLDISVSKTSTRKEDLIVKLLEFLVAPHVSTDAIHAVKEQQTPKSQKLKDVVKGSTSKSTEDKVVKLSENKRMRSDKTLTSKNKSPIDSGDKHDNEEEEENKNAIHAEDFVHVHSESEKEHGKPESKESDGKEDEDDDERSGKGKHGMKRSLEQRSSAKKEKPKAGSSSKKTTSVTTAKSPKKAPSSTHGTSDERNDVGEKVFSRRKKIVDTPEKKSTLKQDVKEKSSGKRSSREKKAKSEDAAVPSNPSNKDIRKTLCELLKKVDFKTATFSDIFKQLAAHYKMDLTPRKAFIKGMLKEELSKLVEENENEGGDEEDEDEDEDEVEDEDSEEEEEHPLPARKKAKKV